MYILLLEINCLRTSLKNLNINRISAGIGGPFIYRFLFFFK